MTGQATRGFRTLKLLIAYDGTSYVGFQRQSNGVSIQQRLEEAFAPLVGDSAGRGPTVAGAGRTDAGVHALGQVASANVAFDLDVTAVRRALNVRLPPDIRVLDVADAPAGFHARHGATAKRYRYRIVTAEVLSPFDRWFVWHAPGRRDVDAMRRAAVAIVGRHDFASFQARGAAVRSTIRTIHRLDVTGLDGEIVIDIEGDGFLRHMVRAVVGTLVEVGSGLRVPESMTEILAARDRQAAGPTVPASGLTLMDVRY
jgi:tRNA pseudouridine38-40 synthase